MAATSTGTKADEAAVSAAESAGLLLALALPQHDAAPSAHTQRLRESMQHVGQAVALLAVAGVATFGSVLPLRTCSH